METQPVVVGVDLGATSLRAGVFTPQGQLLTVDQAEIQAEQGSEKGVRRITQLIERLVAGVPGARLQGVGVGTTGPADALTGVLINPGTLPGWVNVPIAARLQERFGVPACLENDGDAAVLGEYWMGAGQGVSRLYMVTLGTGIGTAFVVEGRLYRGAGGFHPEGGHQVIDPDGPPCYCGARGCWESLASGTAIAKRAREALADSHNPLAQNSILRGEAERIDARDVVEAARAGDALAQQIIEQAADYFGMGLFNLLMLFFPDMILLSGGVMRNLDLFMPAIQGWVEKSQPYLPSGQVKIAPAKLGYYAGIYGAAYAILQRVNPPG
jgi:glucokinase